MRRPPPPLPPPWRRRGTDISRASLQTCLQIILSSPIVVPERPRFRRHLQAEAGAALLFFFSVFLDPFTAIKVYKITALKRDGGCFYRGYLSDLVLTANVVKMPKNASLMVLYIFADLRFL